MKSFLEWLDAHGRRGFGDPLMEGLRIGRGRTELLGSAGDSEFIPTVDVGLSAHRMHDELHKLAKMGYVGKIVTVQYGKNGETRTGRLVKEPNSDGPGFGYWLD